MSVSFPFSLAFVSSLQASLPFSFWSAGLGLTSFVDVDFADAIDTAEVGDEGAVDGAIEVGDEGAVVGATDFSDTSDLVDAAKDTFFFNLRGWGTGAGVLGGEGRPRGATGGGVVMVGPA